MEIQTEEELKEALSYLEQGQPFQAYQITSSLFLQDLECKEVSYTNRCCTFWIDTAKGLKELDEYERGQQMLAEWKSFCSFLAREKFSYEPAFYAVRKGYFNSALKIYTKLMDEKDAFHKAEIYRNAGICYKELGDFENAKNCLSEANSIYPNIPSVLAELADCYALCGEDKFGKVLFREAFFINPEAVDLDFLDSEIIKCLVLKTKEKGYGGKVLLYWIPVFGILYGIFNIKRELTTQEVCRLKQSIYAMESEYKDPKCNTEILVPKLLNSYFWLIDHYELKHESVNKINEILLRIKILDSSVYNQYVK